MMKKNYFAFILCTTFLISCESNVQNELQIQQKENEGILEENLGCDIPLSEFIPDVNEYNFFIEAEVDNRHIRYKQVNYEWTNVSNKYFTQYEETWLQAFNDSLNSEGSFRIRFHDVDILDIELPYTIKESEGFVTWYDSRMDQVIENEDICMGADNGCLYKLSASDTDNTIVIEKTSEEIIEGYFDGTVILTRTGFTPGVDTTKCYQISKGKFRINYRVD